MKRVMTHNSFASSQLGEAWELPAFFSSGQRQDALHGDAVDEIKRLRRCISILVSVLALPAMWTGAEPAEVADTLLGALLGMLLLDFAYLRLKDPAGATKVSLVRAAPSGGSTTPREIGGMLDRQVGDEPESWPMRMRSAAGKEEWSLVALPLGLKGERGVLVAGSQRADFPLNTESLVLSVAANQASIGLHDASANAEPTHVARASSLGLLSASIAHEINQPLAGVKSPAIVFVVENDVSVRESLEALIHSAGWTCETYASAQDFLARPRASVPGCLILDVELPGVSGFELQRRVSADRTDLPIIFISGHGDIPSAVQAMKAGAVEFLTRPFRDDVLLDAIEHALERSRAALDGESALRNLRERYASLSRREREVLTRVVSGRLNKQVAAELVISVITVKAHRGRVMRKMNADSLAQLVTMVARLNAAG